MPCRKSQACALEHEDAPVLRLYSAAEFRGLLGGFSQCDIVPERFPVASRLHHGWKATLYNAWFRGCVQQLAAQVDAPLRVAPDGAVPQVTAPAPAFDQRDDFGNFDANLRFIAEAGPIPSGSRVLEIGSGKGRLLQHLLASGYAARGVEVNPEFIADSRRLHGALPIDQVSGVTLPFADASFDVVLSFDVFEHIRDSDAHLREVRRVLVRGGHYLLQTPNKWTNTVFETIRWRSFTAWRADHCALHSYRQIIRRFARHGFVTTFYRIPW